MAITKRPDDPTLYDWELNEHSTHFDSPRARPSEDVLHLLRLFTRPYVVTDSLHCNCNDQDYWSQAHATERETAETCTFLDENYSNLLCCVDTISDTMFHWELSGHG